MRPSATPPPNGVYCPCVTFFNEDESIDIESIQKHVLRLAQGGITGFVIQGSNGEAVHLDAEERQITIRTVRETLNANGFSHLKIIAGTGLSSRKATLSLTKQAASAGADFALVLPPSYWPGAMSKPVLLDYYKTVADQAAIPVCIYNFPMVASGIDLDSDLIVELAAHPNIVGVKLTCGNLGKLHRICTNTSQASMAVLAGKSEFFLHGLVAGSSGVIAALVNLAPKSHVELYKRYLAGDLIGAKAIQDVLSDADGAQAKLGVGGLKAAVKKYHGYGSGIARSPLPSATAAKVDLHQALLDRLAELERSL